MLADIKYCGTCGFADLTQNVCQMKRTPIANPQKEFCSSHTTIDLIPKCDLCKQYYLAKLPLIWSINETFHSLCPECGDKLSLCGTCKEARYCDFESNPINLPKQIQKQIQQGNQIMVTTIVNPARIRETCQKNCNCFDSEIGCLRQNAGTCGEWVFALEGEVNGNA